MRDPELVFAVVRPVGTPGDDFHRALAGGLLSYGYTTKLIKLSDILADMIVEESGSLLDGPENERIERLMNEGNELCSQNASAAAVALQGVAEVNRLRLKLSSLTNGGPSESEQSPARAVYVIDSLKRKAEVTTLRHIYGDRLFLVALQSLAQTRRAKLMAKIMPQSTSNDLWSLGSSHLCQVLTLLGRRARVA